MTAARQRLPATEDSRTSSVAALLTVAVTLVATVPVRAAFDPPPKITIIGAERVVRVSAGTESDFDLVEATNETGGPFVEGLHTQVFGDQGSSAESTAFEKTQISSFSSRGEGFLTAHGILGSGEEATVNARSRSDMTLVFTVPINAPYTLTGNFDASGEDEVCLAHATISWFGLDANGLPFNFFHNFDCSSPPGDDTFFASGTVLAGTPLGLTVQAEAVVIAPGSPGEPGQLGSGQASYDFVLDFGDRDGDGLLDEWEENGIDFEGPGIEIDLPGWGADPDHKDIFVELDSMAGTFGAPADEAITLVFNAFADAPEFSVDNPDGTAGINLWTIIDELDLANQTLSGSLTEVYAQAQAIKDAHFGSQADRDHASAAEILAAKKEIFRYCLWAEDLDIVEEDLTGFSETPGNLLVVEGGGAETYFADDWMYSEGPTRAALAGLYMHELGHTLNLRHGGQDEINYKPHYQSVMNYGYSVPRVGSSIEGTPLLLLFHLDYSRWGGPVTALDEGALDERSGIETRWPLIFNSAASNDMPPVQLSVASPGPIDWDGSGFVDETPVARDLTRWFDTLPFFIDPDLRSYEDWSQLWYHLSGAPGFDQSSLQSSVDTLSIGISYSQLDALLSAPVTDQRVWGPVIFTDGFEFGDTEGWSATLP